MPVNELTLESPIEYAIIRNGSSFATALKMEQEKPGPHFVRIDETSSIIANTQANQPLGFRQLVCGDRVALCKVRAIQQGTNVPFSYDAPEWRKGQPRAQAIVHEGKLLSRPTRRTNLAFVAETYGGGKSPFVRIYDPLTQKVRNLPKSKGQVLHTGDAVEVDYVVHPRGTYKHVDHHYQLPSDTPYYPGDCFPSNEEFYDVVSTRKLTDEELQRYARAFDDGNDESLAKKAKRMADAFLAGAALMQVKTANGLELNNKVIRPQLLKEVEGELILTSRYVPEGKDAKQVADDLARAARVLKSRQHVLLSPRGTAYDDKSYLATIRTHKLLDNGVTFTFGLEKSASSSLWNGEPWEELLDMEWVFRAPRPQILQSHFAKQLREGRLAEVLSSTASLPAAKILTALFGDARALSAETLPIQGKYFPYASGTLTAEQGRAVEIAANDDACLSAIQAPAGSGKTTTISTVVLEQTRKSRRCSAVTSAMNIAIDSLATTLSKETTYDERRVLVLQGSMYLSKRNSADPYHRFRLPTLLVALAEGELGQLSTEEREVVRSGLLFATRRFGGLQGMDWGTVLHGEVKPESRDEFHKAVELLLREYQPQIVLGTTSALNAWADALKSYITDVVIDEAGTVSLLDTVCFVMSWKNLRSLTLVGDINQLPNFTAPLTTEQRKWGFESALRLAYDHPAVPKTPLTEVFRSHPDIVRVLAKFAYANLQTSVSAESRPLMRHVGLQAAKQFPIVFINCSGIHKETAARSFTNKQQNDSAINLARKLKERLGSCDIRFLTMYSGARDDLNEEFATEEMGLEATAVDAAQGQECDIAVVNTSLVPTDDKKTGFFGMRERITVAISRARHGVFIIGNATALNKVPEWQKLLSILHAESPACFVPSDEILEQLDATGGEEMALALSALGFPAQTATSTTTQEPAEIIDDWMQQWDAQVHADPEVSHTMGRIVSKVDSLVRRSHGGPIEKKPRNCPLEEAMDIDQPILTTAPDTAEVVTGGQEAMDVDEPVQQAEELEEGEWAEPDPEDVAKARKVLQRMREAASDAESDDVVPDHVVYIGTPPSSDEEDRILGLANDSPTPARSSLSATDGSLTLRPTLNDLLETSAIHENVSVAEMTRSTTKQLTINGDLTSEQLGERLEALNKKPRATERQIADAESRSGETSSPMPSSMPTQRPKLELPVRNKPQPKPRSSTARNSKLLTPSLREAVNKSTDKPQATQKTEPDSRRKGQPRKVKMPQCMEDLFGRDEDFETPPQLEKPHSSQKPAPPKKQSKEPPRAKLVGPGTPAAPPNIEKSKEKPTKSYYKQKPPLFKD